MKLDKLTENTGAVLVCGDPDTDIKSVTIDSRKAGDGVLFVCIKGFTVDGHSFINSAYEKGTRAVIIEEDVKDIPEGMTVYRVEKSRLALASIASKLCGEPSKKLRMIGVTGTNGKTSTTYFMESVLANIGRKTSVIGTIEIRIDGKKRDIPFATSTTPDTVELNQMLSLMADEGVNDTIMEVSSHALELDKVEGIAFDTAIFTNLTQDHLDFHKTMEAYCDAKAKLFKMCKRGAINIDDPWADRIMKNATCEITTYGIEKDADVKASNIVYLTGGSEFDCDIKGEKVHFTLSVPGKFSVYNALGVIAAAYSMGISVSDIQKGISSLKGVPGRIQAVPNNRGINVIVDYAHTPDGLENILNAVREFTSGRVITVFGCGGDRDKTKRPIMGEIAGRLSDIAVITSDNPRSEEPEDILKMVEEGTKKTADRYEMYVDRREAIFRAVALAQKGDTVVIAGKGHENYEIFKDRTIHFDDYEVAEEALG